MPLPTRLGRYARSSSSRACCCCPAALPGSVRIPIFDNSFNTLAESTFRLRSPGSSGFWAHSLPLAMSTLHSLAPTTTLLAAYYKLFFFLSFVCPRASGLAEGRRLTLVARCTAGRRRQRGTVRASGVGGAAGAQRLHAVPAPRCLVVVRRQALLQRARVPLAGPHCPATWRPLPARILRAFFW